MQPLRYSQSALKRLWQDECGIATVYFVTVLPVLFAVVALGEFGLVQVSGARLQAVADAAALAGAQDLGDEDAMRGAAIAYANLNMDPDTHGPIVTEDSVEPGQWNAATLTFIAGATPHNAVRVTAIMSEDNGSAVPLGLLNGYLDDDFVLSRSAIASVREGKCEGLGFISQANISIGSHNTFATGSCIVAHGRAEMGSHNSFQNGAGLHGDRGVQMGSHNNFDNGAVVGMQDLSDLVQGTYNAGLDTALNEGNAEVEFGYSVAGLIAQIQAEEFSFPPYLDGSVAHVQNLPENPVPGRLYFVENDVTLPMNVLYHDIGIVTEGNVYGAYMSHIENVFLVAEGRIDFSAESRIGNDFCSEDGKSAFVAAGQGLQIASWTQASGVQFIAGGETFVASHVSLDTTVFHSTGNLQLSSHTLSNCEDEKSPALVSLTSGVRLVR